MATSEDGRMPTLRREHFEERKRMLRAVPIGTGLTLLLITWLHFQEAFPIGFLAAISLDQWFYLRASWQLNAQQTREIFANWRPQWQLLLRGSVLLTFISVGLLTLCVNALHDKQTPLPLAVRTFVYFACLFGTWLQLHNSFALLYAKLYYQLNPQPATTGAAPRGFVFAGSNEPIFSDFLYVAYTVGLTYSMSDTSLESSSARRVVLFHSLVSFVFFSTVLSTLLNLINAF